MKLDNFIKRPVLSTVISIIIVLLGLIGLLTLPISQYPDIAPPTVEVKASYQGANAQTVVNSVIAPLEEEINGVEDMTYMTSTATNTGDATITVYFKPGSDPDMAAVNVQNRVTKAQGFLPSEVTKAGVTTSKKQSSILLAFTVYSENDKYDQEFLFNYLKINVIPQIKRIGGVGDAQLLGAEYSMRIWLKPDVMAQYGLIPSDVIAALNEQNIEAAPGQFGENAKDVTFQYMLKYKGRLVTPEEFGDIVIRANESGEVLRLRTVADVELGSLSYAIDTRSKGHEGITAMIYQSAGSNATQIINDIKALLEAEKRNFPPGVTYDILLDTNDFLFASIHEVIKTLLEAFVLVFLVVFIFLQDFRSTLIPAIAIPVALIGTFFMLKVMGFSINLLTLCALVLAIAIVVDDAIVVVEAVHEKLERGAKSARDASIEAMNEISGALISITLVMMAVFIPVSFMSGITGTFYRQFGLTMAISIAFSAINALTLSPALCALFLKPHVNHEGEKQGLLKRFFVAFNTAYDVTVKKYTKGVNFFIKNKLLSMGAVVAGVCLLFYLMGTTPTGLVPNEDTGTIFISLDMPPGTSLDKTKENMAKIEKLVENTPAIRTYTSISGYSLLSAAQGSSYGSFICKLQDWEERDETESADAINRKLMLEARELVKDGSNNVIKFNIHFPPYYKPQNGPRIPIIKPPTIAEAICPETFAPTACIKRWLPGSSFVPILATTREAIGNAEMPAAPSIGLIFSLENKFKSFAHITPPIVSNTNAKSPSPIMIIVSSLMKASACIWNAIVIPRSRVIIFENVVCAVSERDFKAPHSLKRLPNISIPTRERESGAIKPEIIVTIMGNKIRINCGICFALYFIRIKRSFFVVHILITAGCTMGTSAIYEYATTIIGPRYLDISCCATSIAVGPSAAPIIPIEAASFKGKPIIAARIIVTKIPSCAAPPKIKSLGLVRSGPKSIIHPIPIKSKRGIASLASIPTLKSEVIMPRCSPLAGSPITGERGKFTKIAPKPIGRSKAGSISFLMAR